MCVVRDSFQEYYMCTFRDDICLRHFQVVSAYHLQYLWRDTIMKRCWDVAKCNLITSWFLEVDSNINK